MKNNFFFSAITIAMIFVISSLISCQPNACCGGSSGVQPKQSVEIMPPVKQESRETVVIGGVRKFTGWCFCYEYRYGPYVDVRDKDGNDLHVIQCDDQAILNKLEIHNWDYSTGPAGVGGSGDALVMMFPDGKLDDVPGYPKPYMPSLRVTYFYGKILGKNGLFEKYTQLPNPYLDKLNYNTLPKELKFEFDLGDLKYRDSTSALNKN